MLWFWPDSRGSRWDVRAVSGNTLDYFWYRTMTNIKVQKVWLIERPRSRPKKLYMYSMYSMYLSKRQYSFFLHINCTYWPVSNPKIRNAIQILSCKSLSHILPILLLMINDKFRTTLRNDVNRCRNRRTPRPRKHTRIGNSQVLHSMYFQTLIHYTIFP